MDRNWMRRRKTFSTTSSVLKPFLFARKVFRQREKLREIRMGRCDQFRDQSVQIGAVPATWPCLFSFNARNGLPEIFCTRHFLENSADHHCIIILHHQDTVVIQTQAKSTENSKLHMPLFGEFGRSSRDLCHYGGYNAMNLGTIG